MIRAWRPGTSPTACPYFKRMETSLDVPQTTRTGARRAAGPGARTGDHPLFTAFFEAVAAGRLRADRRRQRLPPGGVRPVRPQHPAGSPPERLARLPAPGHEASQPDRGDPRVRDPDPVRGQPRGRRRVRPGHGAADAGPGRRGDPRRAVRSTRPNCSSSPAWGTPLSSVPLGIPVVARPARASASTSRTTSRCTSSTAAGSRSRMQPSLAEVAPALHRCAVAVPAPRSRGHQPLRGRRVRPQQRRRRLPEPDVPLPAARDPVRRVRARRRPRLPGPRRPDVLRRARLGEDHEPGSARRTRPCASTTCRPTRTGGSGSRPSGSPATILNQPAFDPFNAGETSPGPAVDDRRADPGLGRARRGDRAASVVLRPDGRGRRSRSWTRSRCGVHGVEGLRVVDASVMPYVTNGEHLRPGDDAGREGRRPDPGRHAAAA